MNRRIGELAKQAGAYWHHGDFNMGSSVEFQEDEVEKFAELIVRECIKVCGSVAESDIRYRYDYRRGVLDCADTIRQHFGVE